MDREPIVDVADLSIDYAGVRAVERISFTVHPGQIVGLIGGNGAGKSSTLRAIAGINPPTAGRIRVAGHDLSRPESAARAHAVTGYCPDERGLIPRATIAEHLDLALAFRGTTHLRPQALDIIDRFGLTYALDRATGGFSHGESRRLAVALAAITSRHLLVLDEPFDGVDPLGVDATIRTVRDAAAAGVAVLVSTHLLSLMTETVHDVVVMAAGRLVDRGPVTRYQGEAGADRYTGLLRGAVR